VGARRCHAAGGGQTGQNLKLTTHDTIRFGVAGALDITMSIGLLQKQRHLSNDGTGDRLFAREQLLFGDAEALIGAPVVDEGLHDGRDRLLEDAVERVTEVGIDPALEIDSGDDQIAYASFQHGSSHLKRMKDEG